ncbi:MAG: phytanoyl-CoA dioxygenase family protein [Betaproteobacteria bacterium]|jgi:hypothetical protein
MKAYIFPGYTPEKFVANIDEIVNVYRNYGVSIFPGLLDHDRNYLTYTRDLEFLFDDLVQRRMARDSRALEIGDKLSLLASVEPLLGKIIANLGTQHNKFFNFNKIKYSDYLQRFLEKVWSDKALIVTPQAGDTLHLFPPGQKFHRYNLPPHQDYQYLMQSPRQITMYFGISEYHEGVGGLRIWEKSHNLGILKAHKNENGAFEVHDWEQTLKGYPTSDYFWRNGDFGIFDSLLAHSSIPNTTEDRSRIVQIFRYSDINDDVARSYDFGSTTYPRQGCHYEDVHNDLYVQRQ